MKVWGAYFGKEMEIIQGENGKLYFKVSEDVPKEKIGDFATAHFLGIIDRANSGEEISEADQSFFMKVSRNNIYSMPEAKLINQREGQFPYPLKLNTVEDAIAKKMAWAVMLTGDYGSFCTDKEHDNLVHLNRAWAGLKMSIAVPYVWNDEMFRMVAMSEIPRHTVSAQMPFQSMWFTFDKMFPLSFTDYATGKTTDEPNRSMDSMLITQAEDAVNVVILGVGEKGAPLAFEHAIKQGVIYPDEIPRYDAEVTHDFLACMSFINSPFVVLEKRGLCRQRRRYIGLKKEVSDSNIVRFILLRSPLSKRDYEPSQSGVDWKHRWLVRGHHRAQWCPSTKDHKLMWIAPYVKGPEGMPMKIAAYKVVR